MNDIPLNSGPERDYLWGTCDKTVDWEDRRIICVTNGTMLADKI
jgi:hypothetical protein